VAFKPAPAKAPPAPAPAATGNWRVQLGAFGVPGNADALWAKLSGRSELAGHRRINVPVGKVTKLQAGGFASQSAAASACASLTRAGYTCLPAQD
jgi:cell division septation protein DedD